MANIVDLNFSVDSALKHDAEIVLNNLGLSMATAIDIYLKQITLTGRIPFDVELPMAPDSINAKFMTASDIRNALKAGEEDFKQGRYIKAKDLKKKVL
jgi:addiction module RelB/DinJ family antitoxin